MHTHDSGMPPAKALYTEPHLLLVSVNLCELLTDIYFLIKIDLPGYQLVYCASRVVST